MGEKVKNTLLDRWLDRAKNRPVLAAVCFVAIVLVGIAGALSSVTTIWGFFSPKTELSKEEREAVFNFVGDLRKTQLFVSIFYQSPHEFIDGTWQKVDPSDVQYESGQSEVSVLDLANRVGRHRDMLDFRRSRIGTTPPVHVLDLDTPAGFDPQVTVESVAAPQQLGSLKLSAINVVTVEPNLLPASLAVYDTDLNVASAIRTALRDIDSTGQLASFAKVLRTQGDFMVLSHENRRDPDTPLYHFTSDAPLYIHTRTVQEFLSATMALSKAVEDWAKTHGIDLGDVSREAYDRRYRASH
jgi:hypothetical protein